MIQQALIKGVFKLAIKQFKLDKMAKILKYVEEPNDCDNKVDNLNDRVKILEKIAHKPRDFVRCEQCTKRIEEAGKLMQNTGDETI